MEKERKMRLSIASSEEKPESRIFKEFCENGECEIKVYKNRRYMRRKKKVS